MRIKGLIWDNINIAHIGLHGITKKDVEEVCLREFAVKEAKEGRLMIVGTNNSEKFIAVIIDPEPEEGVYYPVTARTADKKEQKIYQEEKGKHEQED